MRLQAAGSLWDYPADIISPHENPLRVRLSRNPQGGEMVALFSKLRNAVGIQGVHRDAELLRGWWLRMSIVWDFIQNQLLGMKWLNKLIGMGLSALGLDITGQIGGSIQFFLYDVIKITVLLCFLILFISYIQSYFPPERSKKILGRFHGIWANIIAALLGTVTPFCSCSSIPLFIFLTFIRRFK